MLFDRLRRGSSPDRGIAGPPGTRPAHRSPPTPAPPRSAGLTGRAERGPPHPGLQPNMPPNKPTWTPPCPVHTVGHTWFSPRTGRDCSRTRPGKSSRRHLCEGIHRDHRASPHTQGRGLAPVPGPRDSPPARQPRIRGLPARLRPTRRDPAPARPVHHRRQRPAPDPDHAGRPRPHSRQGPILREDGPVARRQRRHRRRHRARTQATPAPTGLPPRRDRPVRRHHARPGHRHRDRPRTRPTTT